MCSPTHFGQMYYTQKSCVIKIQFVPGFCQGSLHVTKKRRVTVWLCGVQTRPFVHRKSCLNSTQSNFCNLLKKKFKVFYKQNFSGQVCWPLSICRCWGNWKSIKIHYQHSNIILSPSKFFWKLTWLQSRHNHHVRALLSRYKKLNFVNSKTKSSKLSSPTFHSS